MKLIRKEQPGLHVIIGREQRVTFAGEPIEDLFLYVQINAVLVNFYHTMQEEMRRDSSTFLDLAREEVEREGLGSSRENDTGSV